MNIKNISSCVLASTIIISASTSFATKNNTEKIKNITEINTSIKTQEDMEKIIKNKEKILDELKNKSIKKSRGTLPELKLGSKVTTDIGRHSSYAASVEIKSEGILTINVKIPEEFKRTDKELGLYIYDRYGNEIDGLMLETPLWKNQSNYVHRAGLKPGTYELYIANGAANPITTDISLSFREHTDVENENNDALETATQLELGKTCLGAMGAYNLDAYKITVSQDTRVRIKIKENNTINKSELVALVQSSNGEGEIISNYFDNTHVKDITLKRGTNYIAMISDSALTDYGINVSKLSGPFMPEVVTARDDYNYICGYAEKGTTVYVKAGSSSYKKADMTQSGLFSINAGKMKAGTEIRAYAVNSKGVKSSVCKRLVSDETPPMKPIVNKFLANNHTSVTGTTEANATVLCRINEDNNSIIEVKSDSNGKFSFYTGKLTRGTLIEVQAIDGNYNYSDITSRCVENYIASPKVNNISNLHTVVSGTSVKGYTAYAKIGAKYYSAKVDSNGKFSIKIPKQKGTTKVYVFAKHPNGDTSYTVTKTVGYAPGTPTINKVTTKSTKVTGKTSKNCSITMTVGSKTYSGKTDSTGAYSIKIPKQKKGTKITVRAKNSAGFYSLAKTTTVK